MTGVEIDTEASLRASRTWVAWGDEVNRAQIRLRDDMERMQLGPRSGWLTWRLAVAATDLWVVGRFLHLVVERVESADSIDDLLRLAGIRPHPADACPADPSFSPLGGDRSGTFAGELRSPYEIIGGDAVSIGRQLVIRAIRDTAAVEQVRPDEFEIVELSDGRHVVVLPGVTDLSSPDLGLSERHRSVRDLDREAYGSSRTSAASDNGYAQMVWQALVERGLPPGSEIVLVGHSFGADTALDLASDPRFNGADGFRVTHVVAAGYDSDRQLEHVPHTTRVLVLQNRDDAVVIVEKIGGAHVVEAVEAPLMGLAAWHAAGALLSGVAHVVDRADDVVDATVAAAEGDWGGLVANAHDLVTLEPGTRTPRPAQVVAVFDGGGAGAGHSADHYVDYLAGTTDPAVTSFLASIGGGATLGGTAIAVDISVPDDRGRRLRKPSTQKT